MKTTAQFLPLLLLASPALAETSFECELAQLQGSTEVMESSDASGGAYVYCASEGQVTETLTANGDGVLAIGGRQATGDPIQVSLTSSHGESWSSSVAFPDSGGWAEVVLTDIPMMSVPGDPVTVTITATGTNVDLDYVSTETCAKVFTCNAKNRDWSVDENSPNAGQPGLYDVGLNFFQPLGNGAGYAAMGSNFDPSTGKSVVKTLGTALAGAKFGPAAAATAAAIAYAAQSLEDFYGQIVSFSAGYTAGKCSVDGCVSEACKFDAELEFKMLAANPFGDTMQVRVTKGAANPTSTTTTLVPGAANGGDTIKITIALSAGCGQYNEASVEWGGSSFYQVAWDWLEFYLSCNNPCAYQ